MLCRDIAGGAKALPDLGMLSSPAGSTTAKWLATSFCNLITVVVGSTWMDLLAPLASPDTENETAGIAD